MGSCSCKIFSDTMKALVTGGCSFSMDTNNLHTWNHYLAKDYNKSYHTGIDASGNDFIIRRVINEINKIKSEVDEIDCVVLWSGISRKMYVTKDDEYLNHGILRTQALHNFEEFKRLNPNWEDLIADTEETIDTAHVTIDTNPIEEDEYGYTWFVPQINPPRIQEFYKKFSNLVNDWEQTTFYIYILQEFCKANGINLYWGHYTNVYDSIEPPEHLKWAYNNIDFSKCFSNNSMKQWVYEKMGSRGFTSDNIHPNEKGHEEFCKSVIQPFITNSK